MEFDYIIVSLDPRGNAWLWQENGMRWIRSLDSCSRFSNFAEAQKTSRTLSGWGVIEILTVGTYQKLYGKE